MNEVVLANPWKRQGVLLGVFLSILAVFYYPTYSSMVSIWMRSETFTHGFLILPICAWLIWRIRDQIGATLPQVNYLGIPILVGLGLLWLLANYVGVLAIEQLAATMMIPVLVFTLVGWQATSVMIFPLFFVMLAVPLGEGLTPYLINITADFTVAMINLVDIPVYREGNFFQLPTGDWSVVAACSGVRYLIASVTLGVLYAYLNYRSPLKRGAFVALSVIVPIIANGLRAFMIVMIGHFSDMELATGVDHLIYGWVFFGLVIGIMFYIGSFWRDDEDDHPLSTGSKQTVGNLGKSTTAKKVAIIATGLVLIIWPIKYQLEHQELDLSHVQNIEMSTPVGWSAKSVESGAWKPAYNGLDREFLSVYQDEKGNEVALFIGYYASQRQGAELGNYNNVLVPEEDEVWRLVSGRGLALQSIDINAPTAVIKGRGTELFTAYFFYVDGQWVTNKYRTKLLQAKARLFGGRNDGAIIAIISQQEDGSDATPELIKAFAATALMGVKATLDQMQGVTE